MKLNRGVILGIMIGFISILAMGAVLTDNAILNQIFNTTDSSINVTLAHDSFSSNVSVGGTLTVTGTSTLTGNTAITGTFTTTGATALNGGLAMDTNKFTVADTSGNTAVGGTFAVTGASTFTGDVAFNGNYRGKVCNMIADDATPSVAGCQIMQTVANSGATAITDLDDPVVGSVYVLVGTSATNAPTIADSGNFALSTAWTGTVDEVLILYVQADNDYIELGRSTN